MNRPSVSKAVRAMQKLGLTVTGVEIAPDGSLRVLTAAQAGGAMSELEAARERRRARKAHGTAQGDQAA